MTGLCVDFGGIAVAAQSNDAGWLNAVRDAYGDFVTDRPARLTITYTPSEERNPWAESSSVSSVHLVGAPSAERFGAVVRQRLPELVGDALVCHAALLCDGEHGFLCCGASGAGKSTLAALLPQYAVGDEVAVVRERAGGLRVSPAPFGNARNADVRLRRVFVIRHGSTTERARVRGGRAMALLNDHLSWPTDDAAALARAFALLTRVVQTVPVWDLAFVPTTEVWDTIAGGE